jgi:uncharacterized protein (DUF2267 family)
MKYDQFVGQVQSRAHLGSLGDAVAAIRATLETLGERLSGGEAKDLASQLPREIGYYLFRGAIMFRAERFGFREFVDRVAFRESADAPRAAFHARVVMEVVGEAISLGELEDVAGQLPGDFAPLFAGSTGNARTGKGRVPELESFESEPQRNETRTARTANPNSSRGRARSQRQHSRR